MFGTNGSSFQPSLFPVEGRWPDSQKPDALVHLMFSGHVEKASEGLVEIVLLSRYTLNQARLLSVGKARGWISKGLHLA